MRSIPKWLLRQYEKVRAKGPNTASGVRYQDVPSAARVTNQLSNRAFFASCVYRRRGYIAQVEVSDFVNLISNPLLKPERQEELLNAWLRGAVWQPLLCMGRVEGDRWILDSFKGGDIAVFLDGRQRFLNIQLLEPDDPPATKENLAKLKAGLFTRSGKRCPVNFARATY